MWNQQNSARGPVPDDPHNSNRLLMNQYHNQISSDASDNCKSIYDSHNTDSGFLSGSNLLSSSSIEEVSSGSNLQREPTDTHLTSSGCLDSGIDISDQLSSLVLSGPQGDEGEAVQLGSGAQGVDVAQDSTTAQLSPNHLAILREIFTRDDDGDTQFHIAVMRGFVEIVMHVSRLLPHQALLDYPNNKGKTLLHLAVTAGISTVARHLVVCGASPVTRDSKGNTPLHVACASKSPEMVTHLTRPVTHSEVINARLLYSPTHTPGLLAADLFNFQGETCVHVAARAGEKEILHHLTCYGADINAKDCRSGRTALHYAVELRESDLVAHLVNNCRANVNSESYAKLSPYQLAIANCVPDIATQLLDLGAPALILPASFMQDTDSEEEEEDYDDYDQAILSSLNSDLSNGGPQVDDIRLAGIAVSHQPYNLPPVSTAPHTINADLYF